MLLSGISPVLLYFPYVSLQSDPIKVRKLRILFILKHAFNSSGVKLLGILGEQMGKF